MTELDLQPGVDYWTTERILTETTTGDGIPWEDELDFLWGLHAERTFALLGDIRTRGIVHPVQIARENHGRRYRVVDGHHRIAVALALGRSVPVRVLEWENEPDVFDPDDR